MEPEPRLSAVELFNRSLEFFRDGNLEDSVTYLRAGFYENLYIAPALLGEEFSPQPIWHATAEAEPRAAVEYVNRYGRFWKEEKEALTYLEEIWNDPLVRRELRSFINHSKAIQQSSNDGQRTDLLKDRSRFGDRRRISRTQSEILGRLRSTVFHKPLERPRLSLIILSSHDPAATVEFYRRLFQMEPVKTSRQARGYAEFDLPGVCLAIHGNDRLGDGDPYGLGQPPLALGWGAIFVIRVSQIGRYHDNAVEARIDILDSDMSTVGQRFFLVKDPSGYLVEVAED